MGFFLFVCFLWFFFFFFCILVLDEQHTEEFFTPTEMSQLLGEKTAVQQHASILQIA